MKISSVLLLILGLIALGECPAQAYIPPSQFIIKTMVAKRPKPHSIRIRTTVTAMEAEKITVFHFKESTYFDLQSQTMKSRATDDSGKDLYYAEHPFRLSEELLFGSNPATVIHVLREAGILIRLENEDEKEKTEMTWLGRWKGLLTWVIGGKKANEPQLWIEKDRFLPVRLRMSNSNPWAELQCEGYHFYKELPFPQLMTVLRNSDEKESAFLQSELQDLVVNPDLMINAPNTPNHFTEAGNSAPEKVRELIRFYYSSVR